MNITTITVRAGRTFNHPHEPYANFRFELTLSADLDLGHKGAIKPARSKDDPDACLKALQEKAEGAAEEHKRRILEELHRKNLILNGQAHLAHLVEQKKRADEQAAEIPKIRKHLAELNAQEKPIPMDLHLTEQILEAARIKEKQAEHYQKEIQEVEAKLASLRAEPLMLGMPEPVLHPGHPDHPGTDANPFGY